MNMHEKKGERRCTTGEESEILERDKVVEADRTLFEPYFRHAESKIQSNELEVIWGYKKGTRPTLKVATSESRDV